MKILYEIGDTINVDNGNGVIECEVVGVDVFEKPLEGALVYEASYQAYEVGKPQDPINLLVVPEHALRSPLQPESIKFLEESEGFINMLGWREGLEPRPDNSNMPEVLTLLMAIQYDKEGHYGSSWQGKGEYRGIMSNIDRKYDRLDNITNLEIQGIMKTLSEQEALLADNYDLYANEIGESKIDAVADLANYTVLYMTYIRKHFPLVFKLWVDKNLPSYLSDKIDFV